VEAGPCQRTCTRFGWTFLTENSCSCDPPDILSRRESIPFVQDYAHVCESKFPGQSWLCISTDLILQEECHRKEKEYSAGRTVYVKDSQTSSTKMKQQRKHQAHPGLGDRSTVGLSRWDRTHHGSAPELSTVSGTMTFYRQFYAFPLHRTVPYTLDKSSLGSPLSYWWRNWGPKNQGLAQLVAPETYVFSSCVVSTHTSCNFPENNI
jgi:hypothetical protein